MRKSSVQLTAASGQKADEFPQPDWPEMAELPAMEIAKGVVEAGNQGKSVRGNAHVNAAAVGVFAAAADQATRLKAVEKPGDIGVSADHASGDFAAEQTLW
jgi:hypothetical protein